MTKMFFPYNTQPKQLKFPVKDTLRFPFTVNDLVYYWEVGTDGITVYLINEKINPSTPVIKDIVLEETGIEVYLYNQSTNIAQHIFVEYSKIMSKISTLGVLDPFTLGEIDPFTLGHISVGYANWLEMQTSVVETVVTVHS